MEQLPLCFVLMPFGSKPDPTGRAHIDFDRIYTEAIKPAIEDAAMEPLRADEEKTGGIIHKPMFERLLLCEYAVADLTTANANVFYELGVRHTARPSTTQAIFAIRQPTPFDVNFLRALPYELGPNNCFGDQQGQALRQALAKRLKDLRQLALEGDPIDSPLFQLLGEWKPDLSHLKTDIFRDQVKIGETHKTAMQQARFQGGTNGLETLRQLHRQHLNPLDAQETGVIIDLMLSYRALRGWTEMIELYQAMPETLKRQTLVREQLAFALNRRASAESRPEDRQRALQLLETLEGEHGSDSETCGLIGRIYKDLWDEARDSNPRIARAYLKKAVEAYIHGFESDWRDPYPGINAVTLLDIQGDRKSKKQRDTLVPVVRFAVEQRLRGKAPDYWDHASMLELAVLQSDPEQAEEHLDDALVAIREPWEPATTARNLELIREARIKREENIDWLDEIIQALKEKTV